jgi:hypothetical protein
MCDLRSQRDGIAGVGQHLGAPGTKTRHQHHSCSGTDSRGARWRSQFTRSCGYARRRGAKGRLVGAPIMRECRSGSPVHCYRPDTPPRERHRRARREAPARRSATSRRPRRHALTRSGHHPAPPRAPLRREAATGAEAGLHRSRIARSRIVRAGDVEVQLEHIGVEANVYPIRALIAKQPLRDPSWLLESDYSLLVQPAERLAGP